MEIFKKIFRYLNRKYWFFLLIITLISYGQMIWMLPWQDDNALFFKLGNIAGRAGYLGAGPLGEGPYKYTAAFYIPIHALFGFNTYPYFIYALILYFLACFAIYKCVSIALNNKIGKLASFLFACGYIASDGFIRLYNSAATSLSIVFISLIFYFYYKFYKKGKIYFYLGSVIFYFFAVELMRYRTHYLIVIPIVFELIFCAFRKPFKSIITSFTRIVPFIVVFYQYFILNADSRTGQIKDFLLALVHGQFYNLFSFTSSISNIILPNWITKPYIYLLVIVLVCYFVIKKKVKDITLLAAMGAIWFFVARYSFENPVLNATSAQKTSAFVGGLILLFFVYLFFKISNDVKKIYLFFSIWFITNIMSYAAYDSTVFYDSINRYFAHSFFAFVVLVSILIFGIKRKAILNKLFFAVVVVWGFGNLISAFTYQHDVLINRSFPVREFYSALQTFVSKTQKGDVFYFDVADNARSYFADAFSVAQMPDETAIAWRYKVDRYDIRRVTDFNELVNLLKAGNITDINNQNLKINHVYTFFYSKDGLKNTSVYSNEIFSKGSKKNTQSFIDSIPSITPTKVTISMSAGVPEVKFPYVSDKSLQDNPISSDVKLIKEAFQYKNWKEIFLKSINATASSAWREDVVENTVDNDTNTAWRPDRILWHGGQEYLLLDLKTPDVIDTVVWRNAYANNTPTEYAFDISLDGKHWSEVSHVSGIRRIDPDDLQIIKFNAQKIRYIKLRLIKSLNDDSPGISEIWAVKSVFANLNINDLERFINKPFAWVPNKESFDEILRNLKNKGRVLVYWQSDKSGGAVTAKSSSFEAVYDGKETMYNFTIPADGLVIKSLRIEGEIPSIFNVESVSWYKESLKELIND